MKKVKDHTIGMGLACSKDICNTLGGDLKIVSSEPGFTQFAFKLPVIAKQKMQTTDPLLQENNIYDLKNFLIEKQEEKVLNKIMGYIIQKSFYSFNRLLLKNESVNLERKNPSSKKISQKKYISQSNNKSVLIADLKDESYQR